MIIIIYLYNYRQVGREEPRGETTARSGQIFPEADVLDQRGQRLVCQVQGQGPQTQGPHRRPLPRHVQGQGTVLQHEGVLRGLQVSRGVPDEPRAEV